MVTHQNMFEKFDSIASDHFKQISDIEGSLNDLIQHYNTKTDSMQKELSTLREEIQNINNLIENLNLKFSKNIEDRYRTLNAEIGGRIRDRIEIEKTIGAKIDCLVEEVDSL